MARDLDHSLATVELGLRSMALCGGDAATAAKRMSAEGHPVDARTLRSWRDEKHTNKYQQICQAVAQEVADSVGNRAMEMAWNAGQAEAEYLEAAREKLADVPAKDLARSVLALTQAKSQNVQTARLLREQPTSITGLPDVGESIAELRALGVIESTAEEA